MEGRILVLLGSLLAGSVSAQAIKPSVMPYPVQVKRGPAAFPREAREAVQREYQRTLRVGGAALPAFARYEGALKGFARTDCDRDDGCLAELARRAEALYGLYVTLDLNLEGDVTAAGRVVRDDGVMVRSPVMVSKPLGAASFEEAASATFAELFTRLLIADLPVTRAVAASERVPAPVAPARVETPLEVASSTPAPAPVADRPLAPLFLLVTGGAVALVGASVAIAGGVIGFSAARDSSRNALGNTLANEGAGPDLAFGRTLTAAGFVGLGAGVAMAVAGLFLFPAKAPTVSLALGAEGPVVAVGGAF